MYSKMESVSASFKVGEVALAGRSACAWFLSLALEDSILHTATRGYVNTLIVE